MNATLLGYLFAGLAVGPSTCLTLEIGHQDAERHRINLVLTAPCKHEVVYKCSLEMQTSKGEWVQVLENVRNRVNPDYRFSTPLVSLQERRKTIVISYPTALSQQYAAYNFRIKAQYAEYGAANRSSAIKVLRTAAFRF